MRSCTVAGSTRVNSAAASITAATGTSQQAMKAKIASGAADGDRHLRDVLAEEGLQLLDAVDHRQHDAAGPLRAEPGGAEGDDLVVQPAAQRLLHAHGGAVRDHGAAVVERRAQHDGDAGAGQRPDQHGGGRALEHAGEEPAEEDEARDAEGQREQAEQRPTARCAAGSPAVMRQRVRSKCMSSGLLARPYPVRRRRAAQTTVFQSLLS